MSRLGLLLNETEKTIQLLNDFATFATLFCAQ